MSQNLSGRIKNCHKEGWANVINFLWNKCRFVKIGLRKWFLFESMNFFHEFIFQKSVKMNIRIKSKNHAPEPVIGFLTKSISQATVMPTTWGSKISLKKTQNFWVHDNNYQKSWFFRPQHSKVQSVSVQLTRELPLLK